MYQMSTNLGYSVTDNASNNDTGLETLSQSLFNMYETHYDVASRRLRCNGHIINLVKTLLFGANGVIKDDKGNEIAALTGSYEGALAKLHHIVDAIFRKALGRPSRLDQISMRAGRTSLHRIQWNCSVYAISHCSI
jgi:hypothetical protein